MPRDQQDESNRNPLTIIVNVESLSYWIIMSAASNCVECSQFYMTMLMIRRVRHEAVTTSLDWYRLVGEWAECLIADADLRPGELVLDIGVGQGELTSTPARRS